MADESKKLLELEGVRGLAALTVVFSHLEATFFARDFAAWNQSLGALAWPFRSLAQALSCTPFNGRFAVWVFWCMSAFALSYRFFALQRDGAPDRPRAYLVDAPLRRYFRLLLPVLGSTLFACALLKAGLMRNGALAESLQPGHPGKWLASFYHFDPSLHGALYWAFYATFFSFHLQPIYNPILWTMRREIIGSYFLFAFLAVFRVFPWRWPLYLGAAIFFEAIHQGWFLAFIAGIALCDLRVNRAGIHARWPHLTSWLQKGRNKSWLLVPALLGLACLVGHLGVDPVAIDTSEKDSLLNILAAVAAIVLVQYFLPLRHLLSRPVPVFLGKISFGLYISHFPFIMSFSAISYLAVVGHLGHLASAFLVAGLTLPLVIGLGYIFYRVADQPGIRVSRAFAAWIQRGAERVLPRPVFLAAPRRLP